MNEKKLLESIKHGGINSLFKRALELGVKIEILKDEPHVAKLTYGDCSKYMRTGSVPTQKALGQFTRNKNMTKCILSNEGVSTPKGLVLERNKINEDTINKIKVKFPVVVKPQDGTRAKGVSLNIQDKAGILSAAKKAARSTKGPVLVEEMFFGEEFRVLVFNKKVLSVVHKIPPTIEGDGESNIKKLIEKYNEPRKDEQKLKVDKEVKEKLAELDLSLQSVLRKKQKLVLKNTFLMANGARLVDKTVELDNYYKEMCIKSVEVLNLQFGGVDIIVKNPTKKGPYVILEVNPNPYYNMHEAALIEGKAVDVSAIILKYLFPKLKID